MNITPDTNVLIRGLVRDDEAQADAADHIVRNASLIALTLPTLCEFVWVLQKVYSYSIKDISRAIRTLISVPAVTVDLPAVNAGLATLEAGGDFADGVIAFEGRRRGGDTCVSFDRKAVRLLKAQGHAAILLT